MKNRLSEEQIIGFLCEANAGLAAEVLFVGADAQIFAARHDTSNICSNPLISKRSQLQIIA